MWGNAQGWAISAVLVLATVVAMYETATPQAESRPMGLISAAYQPIALPVAISVIAPPTKQDCDAGGLYRQAIIQYRNGPKPYDDPIHAAASDLPGVGLVVQARDCGRMHLFDSRPQDLVNYDNDQPPLDALTKLGEATNTIGLGLAVDNKAEEARPYFLGAFNLGRNLFEERITWRELSVGLTLMSEAAQNLARIADQTREVARAEQFRRFQAETDKYRNQLQEGVAAPLGSASESYAGKFAGDIFDIAMNANVERVWRVQAILHLGRYRWNVSDEHRGDQAWADKELRILETSLDARNSDPAILAAVHAAQNLTLEQHRTSLTGS